MILIYTCNMYKNRGDTAINTMESGLTCNERRVGRQNRHRSLWASSCSLKLMSISKKNVQQEVFKS